MLCGMRLYQRAVHTQEPVRQLTNQTFDSYRRAHVHVASGSGLVGSHFKAFQSKAKT